MAVLREGSLAHVDDDGVLRIQGAADVLPGDLLSARFDAVAGQHRLDGGIIQPVAPILAAGNGVVEERVRGLVVGAAFVGDQHGSDRRAAAGTGNRLRLTVIAADGRFVFELIQQGNGHASRRQPERIGIQIQIRMRIAAGEDLQPGRSRGGRWLQSGFHRDVGGHIRRGFGRERRRFARSGRGGRFRAVRRSGGFRFAGGRVGRGGRAGRVGFLRPGRGRIRRRGRVRRRRRVRGRDGCDRRARLCRHGGFLRFGRSGRCGFRSGVVFRGRGNFGFHRSVFRLCRSDRRGRKEQRRRQRHKHAPLHSSLHLKTHPRQVKCFGGKSLPLYCFQVYHIRFKYGTNYDICLEYRNEL